MSRVKDDIWKKFNEVTLANGNTRAECLQCKTRMVGLVSRMKSHYEGCMRKRTLEESSPGSSSAKQATLPFLSGSTFTFVQQ